MASNTRDAKSTFTELDQQIDEIILILPDIVRRVCRKLNHNSSQMDSDGYVQEIFLSLIDHDCRTLRSFDRASKLSTWLFTIAKRHIVHKLRLQSNFIGLDDIPETAVISPPDQEEAVFLKERALRLKRVVMALTEHEQRFLQLVFQGRKVGEISMIMNIERKSVYNEKSHLIKKLRQCMQR